MTEKAKAKIERIMAEPINFKFGDYIGRGFELVQKDMGSFIVFSLIFIIGSMVIGFIPFVGPLANSLIVGPALTVGLSLFANRLDKGERPDFGTFFKGFDHVGQLVLAAIVITLIVLVSMVPFGIVVWNSEFVGWFKDNIGDPTPSDELPNFDLPIWSLLLLLPTIYFGVAYSWAYLFIAFYKMDFWTAMESSRRLITKQWPIMLLFLIAINIIAALGFLLLCIGILFTIPAYMCMNYAAFADVTRLHEEYEDGIENHLIS